MATRLPISSAVRRATESPRPHSGRTTTVSRLSPERATAVAQKLELLRRAKEQLGYTLDALEAAMQMPRSYIGRVISGEKPMTLAFEVALPNDLEALWDRYKTQESGAIVVDRVDDGEATRQLACGLFNLLAPKLPLRAGAPLKVGLPAVRKMEGL